MEHYKQWLLNENSGDDNKFIRFRNSINDFYINKNKVHYKILIEIVKIIAYENLTINKMWFQYRYSIINQIFGSEFEKYYNRSECEMNKGEQIWEIVDSVIFKIGDKYYFYDSVNDSVFMDRNLVEYINPENNYVIHVKKDDLNKNIIDKFGYYSLDYNSIYFSLITLDNKKYIVFNDDSYNAKHRYKLPQIKLNVHNNE